MEKKKGLEEKKKDLIATAGEKQVSLNSKLMTIGNVVHDSVPVSNNEVSEKKCLFLSLLLSFLQTKLLT